MQSLRMWVAGIGLCSTLAAHAVTTAPTVNLGDLSTFAAFTDTDARGFNQAYDRLFTFTLDSEATVRIDMRQIGNSHWLDNYAAGLYGTRLTLSNSSNVLVGAATVDPAFNGTQASCLSGPKCNVQFAQGLSFTAALAAGTYTMELTGTSLGSGGGSVLRVGALVVGAGDQVAYLSAITPATNLPESGSWAMMGLGLLGVAAVVRARRPSPA